MGVKPLNWLGHLVIALLVFLLIQVPSAVAVQKPPSLTEGVVKTVLPNGLVVLTKEVRTAPVVTVQVWYRVGSRNERPGITGISHQIEHLLFKGTHSRPIQFGRLFSALGSNSNAFTSYDVTAYYGTVGSNKVEALLELEADRMVNTRAGKEELESERTVVLSELDGGNNNPATRLYRALTRYALRGTRYQWPVIGDRRDVENFTVEDIQQYYRSYYRPDNAVLVVVGDFQTKQLLGKIRQIFGSIPKPAQPIPEPPEFQPLDAIDANPIVLREAGSVPFLQIVYRDLPPAGHPDNPALDVVDSVLTEGRNSRFYRALVEQGIASSISGYTSNLIDHGWYFLSATPTQGKTLEELEQKIRQEIEKLQTDGITVEELQRVKTQARASFILSNRSITAQAQQLGYNQTVLRDYRYSDRYLEALDRVTVQDVQRVARQYLTLDKRYVGYFQPTSSTGNTGPLPTTTEVSHNRGGTTPLDPQEIAKYLPKTALTAPAVSLSPVKLETLVLPNGLKAILVADSSTPTFSLAGFIEAGSVWDTPEKAGLTSLVAQNLMNGTTKQTAQQIAATLENRGASLGFTAAREGVFINGSGLVGDLPVVLRQLAEVLQFANFPEKEFSLSRDRSLVGLKSELDNPASLARRVFQSTLFPLGHPFHAMRTPESLQAITRADLVQFYTQRYLPSGITLVLMGDFAPAEVKELLRKEFNWVRQGKIETPSFPPVAQPKGVVNKQLTLKGKTQAITIMGHLGIARSDPRFDAAQVLNHILGGDTLASRLGTELRDRQGLTYGVYSFFQTGRNPGAFMIQMQTNPKDTQRAIDLAIAIFRDLSTKGVSQAELDAAKTSLINNFPADFDSPDDIASAILSDAIYGLPMGNFYTYPRRIQAVTLEQVNRVARELFFPDNLLIVTVSPAP